MKDYKNRNEELKDFCKWKKIYKAFEPDISILNMFAWLGMIIGIIGLLMLNAEKTDSIYDMFNNALNSGNATLSISQVDYESFKPFGTVMAFLLLAGMLIYLMSAIFNASIGIYLKGWAKGSKITIKEIEEFEKKIEEERKSKIWRF